MRILLLLLILLPMSQTAHAQGGIEFQPLVNDISVYKNFLDSGEDAGQTLQIISINQLKLKWWFQFEFTADFNRHVTPGYTTDYYIEAGVLTYVTKRFAVNYQRIYGTFVEKPINQIGVRCSF